MNKKENPFTLSFGIEPTQYISRISQANEIIEAFTGDNPTNHMYMISGVRGSGKTVLLSNLSDSFSKMDEWIVLSISPDSDILTSIAAKLYSRKELSRLFIDAKIDLSAFGIGVSIEKGNKIFDIETALEQMLAKLATKGKRVLIAIDEMVNNEHVRVFASSFQILIRQRLPLYLIMTGLYENIRSLQDEKTLTFLYRAPNIILEPLRISSIARSYEAVFGVDKDTAIYMSQLTKGYAFAYQVLGYLCYRSFNEQLTVKDVESLLPEYDGLLEEYVYEKIWHELTSREKEIIASLIGHDRIKVADLKAALDMSSNNLSVYRDRLKKKGIIDTSAYGYISLKLPRFGEIISIWID